MSSFVSDSDKEGLSFGDKFQLYDSRGSGALNQADAWRMLEATLSSVAPGAINYLQAMVDANWEVGVDKEMLRVALEEVGGICHQLSKENPEGKALQASIHRLSQALKDNKQHE
eukprot:scaffold196237_cov23-Prasinocladus_malaysianus.AAC.1